MNEGLRVEGKRNAYARARVANTIKLSTKVKGREHHTPGPCHFNKEQTPLETYSVPTRGFTAAVSVFWGTPPPKPLNCKVWPNRLGALTRGIRRHHLRCEPQPACTDFRFVLTDILTMPF